MNIVEPIFAQCRNKPSELALCAPGTALNLVSYGRLERGLNNICRRIIAAGIAPGNRVAVLIEDPILHAMMVMALTRLGIVTVSASDRHGQWPFKLDGAIADRHYDSLTGKNVLIADVAWADGDDRPLAEKHICRAAPADLCRIVLTSGNDGQQTAVALTHGMISTRLDRQKLFLGPRAPFCDRTHLDLSLPTALGFQIMIGTLWRGGALLMSWDARKTLASLSAYNIQNIISTPQSLLKIAEVVKDHPGSRAKLIAVFSAGSLGIEQCERIRACLCPNLTMGYVARDTTMVASMPAQLVSSIAEGVGYVVPGVTVEIVDEQDRTLPAGQDGNLRICSDHGVREYLDDPGATRSAFRNGWFYPGDRGHLIGGNVLAVAARPNVQQQPIWRASVASSQRH